MNKKLESKEKDLTELEANLKKIEMEIKILKDLQRNSTRVNQITIEEILKDYKKRVKKIRKQIKTLKAEINLLKGGKE